MRHVIRRYAIVFAACPPLFVVCVLFAMSFAHFTLIEAIFASLNTVGTASVLGIGVWRACERFPWPLHFSLKFYVLQLCVALAYSAVWTAIATGLESIRRGSLPQPGSLPPLLLMGVWWYLLFAGLAYVVQTRSRLREKEAQMTAARLDAIRARLNPHFLYNALHTLAALVKFRPATAEGAIERLGDMLRYALKEDGRELVEFTEEYEFTRQYIAFEQLRYEERLSVDLQIDPQSFNFDVLPFSIQTLAENAVHHAVSIRPEGGSIWIACSCRDNTLTVSVRDDGPGGGETRGQSHQFGLRSLRERLLAAHGPSAELLIRQSADGFAASFVVPANGERS